MLILQAGGTCTVCLQICDVFDPLLSPSVQTSDMEALIAAAGALVVDILNGLDGRVSMYKMTVELAQKISLHRGIL